MLLPLFGRSCRALPVFALIILATRAFVITAGAVWADDTHHQTSAPLMRTDPNAQEFAAQIDRPMERMHAGMAAAKPSGDLDRDFAAMMIPHHQGAVDMAEIQLRFGHDERMRRLAQEIIVEQRAEIAVMQRFLDEQAPAIASDASSIQPAKSSHIHQEPPE